MDEKRFLSETGADFTETPPNERPEEEIIYDWSGEVINEQAE